MEETASGVKNTADVPGQCDDFVSDTQEDDKDNRLKP